MPLDPQTLQDLQLLGLKPRLPRYRSELHRVVAWRMEPEQWTWGNVAAYRRLWARLTDGRG